ncbi:hypothetical protein AAAC51_07920 [Priestia megaterium]
MNTQVLIDSLMHGGMAIGGGGDETVTLGELTVKKVVEVEAQLLLLPVLFHSYSPT